MNKFIGIFNIGVLLFILPYSWANSPTGSLSETPNQIQYFGYFKSASENARPTDTIAQTSDHTNIDIIEAGADMDFILQKLQEDSQYGKKAIIMAQAPFFIPDPKTTNGLLLNPAYQSDWKTFAAQIAPYIDTIAAFYPLDEPRLRNINAVTLSTIFGAIKATFPKTNTAVTFDTNYPTDPGFVMPSSLDWVGMDCYNSELQTDWWSQCNGIGMEKILDTLQSEMTSGQKMFLVPQGYIDDATFGNLSKRTVAQNALVGETSDFNNYALDHSNIVAVLAFSWADFSDGGNSWDHGAIDLPVLQNAFRQWGSSIVRANISSSIQTLYLNFLGPRSFPCKRKLSKWCITLLPPTIHNVGSGS
jgi:hypothetical protein